MARILDNILSTILIFLLTFAWASFCLRNVTLALALAAVVASCSSYVIYTLLKKLANRKFQKQKKKKLLSDFAVYLQFGCDNTALFARMLNYYDFTTESIDCDSLIISKKAAMTQGDLTNDSVDKMKCERNFVALCYGKDTVDLVELRKAIVAAKRNNCDKLMVFGVQIDSGALAFASNQFPVKFVDVMNTYELFEHSETLPKIPEVKVKKRRILPQYALNKRCFRYYLTGAVFLFLTSFISYFKLYLLVWATALTVVAFYSLFNRRYNKLPTDVKLE